MAHKASVVRTLMSRASALSSNGVERVAEEKRIVDELKENGYPLSLSISTQAAEHADQ